MKSETINKEYHCDVLENVLNLNHDAKPGDLIESIYLRLEQTADMLEIAHFSEIRLTSEGAIGNLLWALRRIIRETRYLVEVFNTKVTYK